MKIFILNEDGNILLGDEVFTKEMTEELKEEHDLELYTIQDLINGECERVVLDEDDKKDLSDIVEGDMDMIAIVDGYGDYIFPEDRDYVELIEKAEAVFKKIEFNTRFNGFVKAESYRYSYVEAWASANGFYIEEFGNNTVYEKLFIVTADDECDAIASFVLDGTAGGEYSLFTVFVEDEYREKSRSE